MKNIPRILPLVGVAIGGVLAVNALAGARDLPGLVSGARAFAEEAAKSVKPGAKGEKGDKAKEGAATGEAGDASAQLPPPTIKPQAVCAPTAAELAKQAGLSPAELKVLQSLGERRGQLDARENDLSTQLALMTAAEAKLDAKIKALNALKTDVQGLMNQANGREQAEIDRLVKVFEGMKPKDAAPRMVVLDDAVKVPIAAKMKERALSAVLAQMPASEAKKLTEALARRFSDARKMAADAAEAETASAAATPSAAADPADPAKPVRKAAAPRKPAPRKAAAPAKQAAAAPAPAAPAAAAPAPPAGGSAPAAPAVPAKSG